MLTQPIKVGWLMLIFHSGLHTHHLVAYQFLQDQKDLLGNRTSRVTVFSSSGASVYFFRHIFHDWPDSTCRPILEKTVPALDPNHSRVVILDIILPDTGAKLLLGPSRQHCSLSATLRISEIDRVHMNEGDGKRLQCSLPQLKRLILSQVFYCQSPHVYSPTPFILVTPSHIRMAGDLILS